MPSLKELWELNEDGPEPTMDKCIRCKGKGYIGNNGFISNASRNKGECYLCKGRQEYPSNYYVKCLKCKGFGFWHSNGKGNPWQKGINPCTNCNGAGHQKLDDPDNELRPIECLMCKGKGQFHYKGWCHQGLTKFIKGDCPCCEGKGVLLGNYSRCKRCKGKGAFGKNGVISQYHNPKWIEKQCEDCEGKGFLKEEEPVEDDSESQDTDEDSEMKNQPEEEIDYTGIQPEDDGDYYGGPENEEEEEEEVDPTPEGIESECDRCGGKKYYASMGFTTNEKNKRGDCPCCEGKGVYNKNWFRECKKCDGKGFFSPNSGKTNPWIKSGKPCTNCNGKGFSKIDFRTELDEIDCPMCKSKGHYGTTSWCHQELKSKQGDCPCCKGNGVLIGNWDKCDTCKGKGCFRGKSPVFAYSKTKDRSCEDCDGRGYVPTDEDTKKYIELILKDQEEQENEENQEDEAPNEEEEEKETEKEEEEEPKEKEEEEEKPKEEEKEPEEPEYEDGFAECIRCGGKGHYNKFGWCDQGSPTKQGDCPLCKGEGKYETSLWRECPKCDGKGCHNIFGACDIWKSHWSKQPCSSCNEIGYLSTRNESKLKAQLCLLCEGNGHYGTFGWVKQQKRKGNCPLCKGKSEVYGDYDKCEKCEGKGGFNTFGPCEIYKNNKTEDCSVCNGCGYTRSEEQNKLEEEEFEKYGYNNKNHWEIQPMPEKPEGADEGCCIIL